jgi:hypothetical protein
VSQNGLLEFDEYDLTRIAGREEIKIERECPFGELPYFPFPKNDNEKLLNAQRDFLCGDNKAADYLYTKGAEIAGRYITTAAVKNSHIMYLDYDLRQEKAHNASCYIILRYIEAHGWFIKKSYTGYLFLRVLHELYKHTKAEGLVDFVDWDFNTNRPKVRSN